MPSRLPLLIVASLSGLLPAGAAADKPNIIVILVDDMGFSDLGCYGSEIPTPHLDALAQGGVRFTQFYNTARCCPTRAALLTGLYSHQAGVGHMTNDKGAAFPGYRGHLQDRCVTIAEVLKPAGYFTAMTGKWHVGQNLGVVPWERGFTRSLNAPAGGFYFGTSGGRDKVSLFLNGKQLDLRGPELPKDWYSTDLWTDFGLRFIDEARIARQPFFLYLAHNAPHFPLQAPPEAIARFRGKYKAGWDALREARHARQIALGIVDKSWTPAPRPQEVKAWSALTPAEQDRFDEIMAIYAACVWRMDQAVGDLVAGLKQRGVFDDTLILFMSDNGGNAEAGPNGRTAGPGPLGSAESNVFCGESWAFLENTPFRRYKHYNHEGGIATPLIAHWPAGMKSGRQVETPAHLIDIMATCVDVAGATYPKQFNGKPILPMEGVSLRPTFASPPTLPASLSARSLYWEHEGNAAVRTGDWKLVRLGDTGPWELYNLKTDRTEQHNLAAQQREKVQELATQWNAWAKRALVLPQPGQTKVANKSKRGAPAGTFALQPDTDLRDEAAPDIAGKAFTVTVQIEKPGTDGVLVAHGGANLGWALYLQRGQLHFVLNKQGQRIEAVGDDAAIQTARELTATLGPKSLAKLIADGCEIGRKHLQGLLPAQPLDGLQVGRDLAAPVGEYEGPFPFNGTIKSATLQVSP